MDKSAVTADKIDPYCGSCLIERFGKVNRIRAGASTRHHGYGGDRYTFIDDRNTIFLADILSCFDQVGGITADFIIDLIAGSSAIAVHAV